MSLPLATLAMMLGALCWAFALRRRHIARRNAALATVQRFDSGRGNLPGLLRATRGLAIPTASAVASPVDPTEHAVWVRYILEELAHGWKEVFSEARPAQFRVSVGNDTTVVVKATLPNLVLLREGGSALLGDLFDDESPEELAQCSPEFAARVEAQRTSREALYRLRVERIREGESVYVSGVVSEDGTALRLDAAKPGTMLATVPETTLTQKPALLVDILLALTGTGLLGTGFWLLRLFKRG